MKIITYLTIASMLYACNIETKNPQIMKYNGFNVDVQNEGKACGTLLRMWEGDLGTSPFLSARDGNGDNRFDEIKLFDTPKYHILEDYVNLDSLRKIARRYEYFKIGAKDNAGDNDLGI